MPNKFEDKNLNLEHIFMFNRGMYKTVIFLLPVLCLISSFLLTYFLKPSPRDQAKKIFSTYHLSNHLPEKTLSTVLLMVKERYIDPHKIVPSQMLMAALKALEKYIPEIIVKKNGDMVHFSVGSQTTSFLLGKVKTVLNLYQNLIKVFKIISANLNEFNRSDIEYEAVNGILRTLDTHTVLLSPSIYREMKTGTRGSFSGIGIVVVEHNGFLTVIAPIDDTPAAKSGVKAGDKIVKIGDISTVNISLNQAVNLLRGEPNTKIVIWVERKNEPNLIKFELERRVIHINSVNSKILRNNIGYIRIKQFTQTTSNELRKHIIKLQKRGVRSLILDLYNNPGGLLKQATKCADLFLNRGIIYSSGSFHNKKEDLALASTENTIWNGNLVVLINRGSASSSEILTGALKFHHRAFIIGERSFGKGSIQMISENEDNSALKMTIAHYLSAGKVTIQSRGINPHIAITLLNIEKPSKPLFSYEPKKLNIKSEDEEPVLGIPDTQEWYKLRLVSDWSDRESVSGSVNSAPSSVINLAVNFLSSISTVNIFNREYIIEWSKKQTKLENNKLLNALGKKGIDWSSTPGKSKNAALEAQVKFTKGLNIKAGDDLNGIVELRNLGTDPAFKLRALITNFPNSTPKELIFGSITPGESKKLQFSYHVDISSPSTIWPLNIQFFSDDPSIKPDKIPIPQNFNISIKANEKPVFKVHYHIMDDIGGNGDGLCQPGERIRLRIMVTNEGKGISRNTLVSLINKSEQFATIVKGRYKFGRLFQNETRTDDFSIVLKKQQTKSFLKFLFTIEDQSFGIITKYMIHLPIYPSKPGPLPETGYFSLSKNSYLHSGMDQLSAPIGIAYKDSVFPIDGIGGKWVKIQLHPERSAFVLINRGHITTQNTFSFLKLRWKPIYQIKAPLIKVNHLPLFTRKNKINIALSVFHPLKIKDLYIENIGLNKEYRKLFYINGKNQKNLSFKNSINLRPGFNFIRITARTTDELSSRWVKAIYYKK